MDPDFSKWPLLYQLLAAVGASLTGILMYLRGSRAKPPEPIETSAHARELARLLEERTQERARRAAEAIEEIRVDTADVIKALKESIDERFHEGNEEFRRLSDRMRAIETRLAVVEDRQSRPARR